MNTFRDRRKTSRRRVCFAAEAARPGVGPFECAIRDLSPDGAQVQVEISAPIVFDLRMLRDGSTRRARTVWRRAGLRGVVFEAAPAPPSGRISVVDLRRNMRASNVG